MNSNNSIHHANFANPLRYTFFILFSITFLFLFLSNALAANVYIDPSASFNGDGTVGTQASGPGKTGAYNTWSGITFSTTNDYYQKCGTTWQTNSYIEIADKDALGSDRLILGAYYLDSKDNEILDVLGTKPILEETSHSNYLLIITDSSYIHIKNLIFKGGYKQLYFRNNTDFLLIEDCEIGREAHQYGIWSQGFVGGNPSNDYGEIKNCIFDSDIGTSGAVPADQGGTLQDGISLRPGNTYWKIHHNTFIDWPHSGFGCISYVDAVGNPANREVHHNKFYNNTVYREDTGSYNYFRGFGGLGDALNHDNEYYNNIVIGQTVRSQFGGYRNKIYNNIWDTVTDAMNTDVAQGLMITCSNWGGYALVAKENEVYNNTILKADNAGIFLGGNCTKPFAEVKDNIIANNIIYECGNGSPSILAGIGLRIFGTSNVLENHYLNNDVYNSTYTGVVFYKLAGNTYTIAEWNAMNGTDGNTIQNNISGDPKIIDNCQLAENSHAINVGKDMIRSTDFYGTQVPQGSSEDIGACEFKENSASLKTPNNLRIISEIVVVK